MKRPKHNMPDYMANALRKNNLFDKYNKRPWYQRNDYVRWISSPKKEETKRKRLNQMLSELTKGDVYMKMTWNKGKN